MTYKLLDSGDQCKIEQFGPYIFKRPAAQAIWPLSYKGHIDATLSRAEKASWTFHTKLPSSWIIEHGGLKFKLQPNEFGHLGLFPEHATHFDLKATNVLNLFAYTGGFTLAMAKNGARVTHIDASPKVVSWAKDNGALNNLQDAPIRFITEDAPKFLEREIRRGNTYDGIALDPPTFGRGPKNQLFKIEKEILPLIERCKAALHQPKFLLLTSHTPGYTPQVLTNLLTQVMPPGHITSSEMLIPSTTPLPSGAFARWQPA